ncbi:sigma-70 family RNA polymerase sigma factor [Alteromonas lipolytica]|uniref:RNA polymerase subunit sigma-70 n=1 Tax=Alteromonas lipolytica TaxID=1856405 RepID=A0A1E8FCJ9_9ALTE|nr:sigma-70 family RNA polymerase sigma factor [Alteromonas lipolytica]OFI33629.1 RNA polymerase subunit sigma-70 [Alteromonas lipolytica]GGF69852.1 RNA polymerase sigma factor [Alteromonas lipolytica]
MEQETLLPLLCSTAQGNKQDFAQLYKLTSGQVYAVVLKLLQNTALAEEATQDAYIKVWHNAASYQRGKGTVLTWIISIARYRALDLMRHNKVRKESSLDDHHSPPAEDSAAMVSEQGHPRLNDCMDELDNQQRQAIHLAYFKGLSHQEVVDHLSSPLGTIKSWIRRGLQSLQRCLSA